MRFCADLNLTQEMICLAVRRAGGSSSMTWAVTFDAINLIPKIEVELRANWYAIKWLGLGLHFCWMDDAIAERMKAELARHKSGSR